ncbi:MAG TPA: protein kinase [Candidatus Binataceae bacterium]|nr:protein kinase [Candidatus Binataceae bacterium]
MPDQHHDLLSEHYRIIRPLEGGSGKWVYLAHDVHAMGRICVLVEIVDQIDEPALQASAVTAFNHEAELIAGLRNRHLPALYAWFHHQHHHYFATEFIAGQSLAARLTEVGGRLDQPHVIDLALALLDGLEALHGTRPPVVSHDLSPSAIIMTPGGRFYLAHYPLARHFALQPHVSARMEDYAPAEQYAGLSEPRSDLYALGALMYHLLAGQPPARNSPFVYTSARAVRGTESGRVRSLARVPRAAVLTPLRELCPQCAPELAELITQALDPEIERRPDGAAQMRARLLSLQSRLPTPEFASATPALNAPAVIDEESQPGDHPAPASLSGREMELRLRELVGEALTAALSTLACPYCSRRVQAGASYCPFCGQPLGTPALMAPAGRSRVPADDRKWRRWWVVGLTLAGLMWLLAVAVYYRHAASPSADLSRARPPKAAGKVATHLNPSPSPALARLLQDAAKLQTLPPGGSAQALREDLILRAARLNPPAPLPPWARDLIDQGEAELRAATSPEEYKRAAAKLNRGLRAAPWLADAYLPLAQALAQSGDREGAMAAYKNYLLAPPKGADVGAVRRALLALQNGAPSGEVDQEPSLPASQEPTEPRAAIAASRPAARLPDLAGYWYRVASGMAPPSSSQRIKITQAGEQVRLEIVDDCGRASCAPGSDAWRPYHSDPDDPLSDYGGRYLLSEQGLSFGPHQWRLPAELGDCVISTRRLGDISPDHKAIVIRSVNSGSKCRLYQSDIHLWRP